MVSENEIKRRREQSQKAKEDSIGLVMIKPEGKLLPSPHKGKRDKKFKCKRQKQRMTKRTRRTNKLRAK